MNIIKLIVAAILFYSPVYVTAQAIDPSQVPLSQEALFVRCYANLTGLRVAATHPLFIRVKNGELPAIDACLSIFDQATLIPANQSQIPQQQLSLIIPSNPEALYSPYTLRNTDAESVAVLNQFNNFHRLLFEVKDLNSLPGNTNNFNRHNDPSEPALFLTRLLFQQGLQYKDVVTGNYGVRGIRSLGPVTRSVFSLPNTNVFNLTTPGAGLDRGLIWGIGAYTAGNSTWLTDDGNPVTTLNIVNNGVVTSTFNAKRNYGGGIMGLQSYIAMNSGFPSINNRSDAALRMHRRLSQNIYKDLLCRQLPTLRPEDVTSLAANYIAANPTPSSQISFRTSSACLSCHGSIDPMAAVHRSFYFQNSGAVPWLMPAEVPVMATPTPGVNQSPNVTFVTTRQMASPMPTLRPRETPANNEYTLMRQDTNFFQRPDSGDLRYRSYDGTLVWQHFTATTEFDGLTQLGEALAQTNDLYVCAASKYLQFFTGIEPNLSDITDPRTPQLSEDDLYYRNIAINLGLRLKEHQSLSQLVRDILNSSFYQKRGMRDKTL